MNICIISYFQVASAVDSISSETIMRAFETCGIAERGQEVASCRLHEPLRNLLEYGEADSSSQMSIESSDCSDEMELDSEDE